MPTELRLVGVTEIAKVLGVSKQRASQLCNSKGFPDPVDRVAPLDSTTVEMMRRLYSRKRGRVSFEEVLAAMEKGGHALPGKRWRLAAVIEWAKAEGRKLPK
jgi:hypothetical protein